MIAAGHRLGVDQVVRHQVLGLGLRQALLHGALDAHQAGAELVLGQFAHGAHAAVAEVVDVVDLAAAVAQFDQDLDHGHDVVDGQDAGAFAALGADPLVEILDPAGGAVVQGFRVGAAVELHAAHGGEVIALFVEEQAVEQGLHRLFGGRLAGAHHAVDGDAGGVLVGGFIDAQGGGNVGTLVEIVDVDGVELGHPGLAQLLQQGFGDLVVGVGDHLAGFLVHDVGGKDTPQQKLVGDGDLADAGLLHVADMLGGDALVLGDDDRAVLGGDIEASHLAPQALGHQLELHALLAQVEGVLDVEHVEDLLRGEAQGLHQDRHRHLAAAVDAEVEVVLGVELEVQPGTAVGNDAGGEQQLAGGVGLAPVMLEEHAGGAVQLGHDHPLGAVDDEGTGVGHERNLAHVHFLLLHLLHRRLGRFPVHDGQAHPGAQRGGERQAPLLALRHVERGLAQHVADKVQAGVAGVAGNGENGIEGRLQAFGLTLIGSHVLLQESSVGIQLGRQQVRHGQNAGPLGEALADTLSLGKRIAHSLSMEWYRVRQTTKDRKPMRLDSVC